MMPAAGIAARPAPGQWMTRILLVVDKVRKVLQVDMMRSKGQDHPPLDDSQSHDNGRSDTKSAGSHRSIRSACYLCFNVRPPA